MVTNETKRVLGIVVLVCGLAAGQARGDLLGYWPFDGDVLDVSGMGNDGTLPGSTFGFSGDVPGILGSGQSLDLAGGSESVGVAGNGPLSTPIFTISMFVKDRGQTSALNRLISRGADTFEIGINKAIAPQNSQYSFFSPQVGGWTLTNNSPPTNVWEHVAFVSDGTNMRVHVNGGPTPVWTSAFTAAPSGNFRIGARENGLIEGFNGLIDDVAIWNEALTGEDIATIGTRGVQHFLDNGNGGGNENTVEVGTRVSDWKVSTSTEPGGGFSDWIPSGNAPPAVETFTLDAEQIAPARSNVIGAAAGMSVEPVGSGNGIRFFRTTFELDPFASVEAALQLTVDNGAQVWINGELIATETSFSVENWAFPLPGLIIHGDGSVADEVKFEVTAATFNGFVPGENEVILAIRNPDDEGAIDAGGFGFRLSVTTQAIPEPCSGVALIALGVGLVERRLRRAI